MITHDTKAHMFEINYPEGRAYLEYTEDNGTVTVIHTIVPEALGENRHPVKSDCSYMTAWMKRNKITT